MDEVSSNVNELIGAMDSVQRASATALDMAGAVNDRVGHLVRDVDSFAVQVGG